MKKRGVFYEAILACKDMVYESETWGYPTQAEVQQTLAELRAAIAVLRCVEKNAPNLQPYVLFKAFVRAAKTAAKRDINPKREIVERRKG